MTIQSSRGRALPRQSTGRDRHAPAASSAPLSRPVRSHLALLVPMVLLALLGPAAPVAMRFPLGALAGALAAFFVVGQVRSARARRADPEPDRTD